jgi:hypothetical protein
MSGATAPKQGGLQQVATANRVKGVTVLQTKKSPLGEGAYRKNLSSLRGMKPRERLQGFICILRANIFPYERAIPCKGQGQMQKRWKYRLKKSRPKKRPLGEGALQRKVLSSFEGK